MRIRALLIGAFVIVGAVSPGGVGYNNAGGEPGLSSFKSC